MTMYQHSVKEDRRLFRNPILERFTRTHIAAPISIFILYACALLYWNVTSTSLSMLLTVSLFVVGWFVFTWVEYLVHRHMFHMQTYTKFRKQLQHTIHGIHHDYPKDKLRLAMPPLLSVSIATGLLFVLRLIMGDFVFAFLPGFLVGYAGYLAVHYMVHAYAPPKNKTLRSLWINHSIHHYKNKDTMFGVSSPLWDHVYGTLEKKKP